MYGVKKLEGFNEKEYKSFITKLKDKNHFISIISDTAKYKRVINLGRTVKERNILGQPVQIIYFENNTLKSFHANCYAKGSLTNLNWNTEERFSTFLPKSAIKTDSIDITLEDYINIYPKIRNHENKKFTVLIFWTLMLEKVSKSAIETAFTNAEQYEKENEISFILINTDNFFSNIE